MKQLKKEPVRRIRPVTGFTLHPVAKLAIQREAERMGLNQSQWLSQFVIAGTGYDAVTGQKVKKAS